MIMIFRITMLFVIALTAIVALNAQKRDYLTQAEVEIVRNNQDIDLRIAALSHMIDRRFKLLGIDSGGPKPPKNSEDDWGEEPKGTRLELFTDIKQILEKAVDDIDSIPGRLPEKMKELRKGENLFNKAVHSLSASANRWLPFFKKENAASGNDEGLYSMTAASIELCEQIIDASGKVK